jgi:uncharacterized protein with von Willebrand factor type A (vWA) domain
MVVSDAGAARERVDRGRIATSQKFLRYVQEHWSPVAWINPMPASRWKTSSSSRIARVPGCRMFELTEDGLVAAVDFLRGKVSGAW